MSRRVPRPRADHFSVQDGCRATPGPAFCSRPWPPARSAPFLMASSGGARRCLDRTLRRPRRWTLDHPSGRIASNVKRMAEGLGLDEAALPRFHDTAIALLRPQLTTRLARRRRPWSVPRPELSEGVRGRCYRGCSHRESMLVSPMALTCLYATNSAPGVRRPYLPLRFESVRIRPGRFEPDAPPGR
jgi:hypothetical protein